MQKKVKNSKTGTQILETTGREEKTRRPIENYNINLLRTENAITDPSDYFRYQTSSSLKLMCEINEEKGITSSRVQDQLSF